MPESTLLDVSAAAEHLAVTERWVRRAVAERRLPFVKVGRNVRFIEADLQAFIKANTVAPVGDAA